MITQPQSISIRSWIKLSWQKASLLRAMENQKFSQIVLNGKTLDVGGGREFGYVDSLQINGLLHSANISAELNPTYVCDLNLPLPIPASTYDNVLCFNTLEHVFEEKQLVGEMLRILSPGGRFVFTIPFFYKRHGRYGDFHRHTAEFWEETLIQNGIPTESFVIEPMIWCPLSAALSSIGWFGGGLGGKIAKLLVMGLELARQSICRRGARTECFEDFAMAYYIDGIKRTAQGSGATDA